MVPAAETTSLTPVSLISPLWLLPWRDAHKWVWPRTSPEQTLVVLPFSDPFADAGRTSYLWLIYAEQLALQTRLNVRGVVAVQPGKGVVGYLPGQLPPYEHTLPSVRQITPAPLAVLWGEVGATDAHESTVRMRSPALGDPAIEATMRVPAGSVPDALLQWLVQQGRASRALPPDWYAPPQPGVLNVYGTVMYAMLFSVLAKNKVLPVPPSLFEQGLDLTHDLPQHPQAPPQSRVFPLTLSILGEQMGYLSPARKQQALQIARAAQDPRDLVALLSPHLLRVLGASEEADQRARAFGTQPGPYQDWLRALSQPGQ